MTSFSLEVDDGPVLFSLFQMLNSESHSFVTPQTTSQKKRKESSVPPPLQPGAIWRLPKRQTLFGGEPVTDPHALVSHPLHAPYPSCQVGAQKAAV